MASPCKEKVIFFNGILLEILTTLRTVHMFSSRGTIQSEQNHIFVVFFFYVLFGEAFSVYWSFAYTLWFLMGFGFIFCMCVSCVFICFAFKMFFVSCFNCFPIVCLLFSQKKDFWRKSRFWNSRFWSSGEDLWGLRKREYIVWNFIFNKIYRILQLSSPNSE